MSESPLAPEPWPNPATLTGPELKPEPKPEPKLEPTTGRSSARNYLSRSEQRRIFWLFMPPALIAMLLLGWVERRWLADPPLARQQQVDTTAAQLSTDPALADAVVIEAELELPSVEADEYGASIQSLARVRDDTVFRAAEQEAWFQIWSTLRSANMAALARSPTRQVSFSELFGQPRSYRGRLVRFQGILRRLEQVTAPPNDSDIHDYWQGWLEPDGGPVSPIVVYFLRLPSGMPHGIKISERVDVVGYFFKRWAYSATDTVRIAPLVLALEPIWKPRPAGPAATNSLSTVALVTMAALVLVTVLGIRAAGQGVRRRQPPSPTDLSATLSDVELFSPDQALRQLADSEYAPRDRLTKEP